MWTSLWGRGPRALIIRACRMTGQCLRRERGVLFGCLRLSMSMLLATVLSMSVLLTTEAQAAPVHPPVRDDVPLPLLGDASSAIISTDQERKLGRAWLREMRSQVPMVHDPVVEDYVENLVYRLAAASDVTINDFSVVVINSPDINAFAVPGGVIGINAGLLLAAQNEGELASVLSHELSHLRQRHFARNLEESRRLQWLTMGAILAGIAMAASGNEAGMAAVLSAQAASVQNQLQYSRLNEQEADRMGLQLLQQAGYDPSAMVHFFERLARETENDSRERHEFLQTHPLTQSRIADMAVRVQQLQSPDKKSTDKKPLRDSAAFRLARIRLQVAALPDPPTMKAAYQRALQQAGDAETQLDARYRLVLLHMRLREPAEARKALSPVVKAEAPIEVQSLLSEIDVMYHDYDGAVARLREQLAMNPGNRILSILYARALIGSDDATAAVTVLESQVLKCGDDPWLWGLLSDAASAAKDDVMAHRARAEMLFLSGDLRHALDQLDYARDAAKGNYPMVSRLRARRVEMNASRDDDKF